MGLPQLLTLSFLLVACPDASSVPQCDEAEPLKTSSQAGTWEPGKAGIREF
jgi:hypothetical protein